MEKEGNCTGEHVYKTEGDGEVCFIHLHFQHLKAPTESQMNRMTEYQMTYRLRILKEKLKEQRKHLDELDRHMYVPCFIVATIPDLYTQSILYPFLHRTHLCLTDTFVIAIISPKNKVVSKISTISRSSSIQSSPLSKLLDIG
jgi:hypothetical protein